jgi:hypothetical protein
VVWSVNVLVRPMPVASCRFRNLDEASRRCPRADLHGPSQEGKIMKRMSVLLAVAVLAASILSGCVIVPVDGFYGYGYHYRPYAYPYPYRRW